MKNKILLVEDDVSISDIVKNHLTKEGFEITVAFDGETGLLSSFRTPLN